MFRNPALLAVAGACLLGVISCKDAAPQRALDVKSLEAWQAEALGHEDRHKSYPALKKTCKEALQVLFPVEDFPTPEEAEALKGCFSSDLYYGHGTTPDPVKARKCAWLEFRDGEMNTDGIQLGAASQMLTVIYANGQGAKRNVALALKMGCSNPHLSAHQLEELALGRGARVYEPCDDPQTTAMMRSCAVEGVRAEKLRREARLTALEKRWSPVQRAAFKKFRGAWLEFFGERIFRGELSSGGLMAQPEDVYNEAEMEEAFVRRIEALAKGPLPAYTAQDYAQADSTLNAVYRQVMAEAKESFPDPDMIRSTQRAWLPYRDAAPAFGATLDPSIAPESWLAWMTLERVAMLRELL